MRGTRKAICQALLVIMGAACFLGLFAGIVFLVMRFLLPALVLCMEVWGMVL